MPVLSPRPCCTSMISATGSVVACFSRAPLWPCRPGTRVGLVGRNGTGKTTLVEPRRRRPPARRRYHHRAPGRPARPRRPGGPQRTGELARYGPRRGPRKNAPPRRGRVGHGSGPHCRDPHPPRRHRRPFGTGPSGKHPGRTGLRRGLAVPALCGIFRRLADAGQPGGGPFRAARSVAPRRADKSSRPRSHAVAAVLSRRVAGGPWSSSATTAPCSTRWSAKSPISTTANCNATSAGTTASNGRDANS